MNKSWHSPISVVLIHLKIVLDLDMTSFSFVAVKTSSNQSKEDEGCKVTFKNKIDPS